MIESKEEISVIYFLKTHKILLKGFTNGRIETLDGSFICQPFKGWIDCITVDQREEYIAIASESGEIKVFDLEKLFKCYFDEIVRFQDHDCNINQIQFR